MSMNHIDRLRRVVHGRVVGPGEPDYDRVRSAYYTAYDGRPAAVVLASDADDVIQAVRAARESGLELAVRSGGHSVAGHSVTDGGILLDLSPMRRLDVDAVGRTAWADAGLTAGAYTAAVGAHGLATGFGDAPSVGLGGLTLGGGVGFLHRKHGLTVDSLLAAELVTADGELVYTDARSHPDLFWAIRGGGGNFGVAARFRYRLHAVDEVVGGMLVLPATPDVVTSFVEEALNAPETVSGIINIMTAPPMLTIPPEHHGRPVVMALMVHAGPPMEAERVLAPFRSLARPLIDGLRPLRYRDVYEGGHGPQKPAAAAVRSFFMDRLERADADTILDRLQRGTAPMRVVQLRVLGGAVARVPADATAFAHRRRAMMASAAAVYGDPAETDMHRAWTAEAADSLRQGEPGAYIGFLSDEGEARAREAYPAATWERLRRIKATWDPSNLFRRNQNVRPAARAEGAAREAGVSA